MNCKTKSAALAKLKEYRSAGVVWRYTKTGRWNWATIGSGCYCDILNTLSEIGDAAILNSRGDRSIAVDSVFIVS